MSTNKERTKEHLAMKTLPIVSQQEWEAARHGGRAWPLGSPLRLRHIRRKRAAQQGNYLCRVFSLSSARFNSSSFCPASPSLPSAVRRW